MKAEVLLWKKILRRAQLAMKPLFASQPFSWRCLGRGWVRLHDSVHEGRSQCDPCGNSQVQSPRERQWHDEHDCPCNHVGNRRVSCKGDLVDAFPPLDGLVPLVGNG